MFAKKYRNLLVIISFFPIFAPDILMSAMKSITKLRITIY